MDRFFKSSSDGLQKLDGNKQTFKKSVNDAQNSDNDSDCYIVEPKKKIFVDDAVSTKPKNEKQLCEKSHSTTVSEEYSEKKHQKCEKSKRLRTTSIPEEDEVPRKIKKDTQSTEYKTQNISNVFLKLELPSSPASTASDVTIKLENPSTTENTSGSGTKNISDISNLEPLFTSKTTSEYETEHISSESIKLETPCKNTNNTVYESQNIFTNSKLENHTHETTSEYISQNVSYESVKGETSSTNENTSNNFSTSLKLENPYGNSSVIQYIDRFLNSLPDEIRKVEEQKQKNEKLIKTAFNSNTIRDLENKINERIEYENSGDHKSKNNTPSTHKNIRKFKRKRKDLKTNPNKKTSLLDGAIRDVHMPKNITNFENLNINVRLAIVQKLAFFITGKTLKYKVIKKVIEYAESPSNVSLNIPQHNIIHCNGFSPIQENTDNQNLYLNVRVEIIKKIVFILTGYTMKNTIFNIPNPSNVSSPTLSQIIDLTLPENNDFILDQNIDLTPPQNIDFNLPKNNDILSNPNNFSYYMNLFQTIMFQYINNKPTHLNSQVQNILFQHSNNILK